MPSGEISARDARDLRATSELVVTLVLFGSSFPAFKLATERFGVGTVVGLRFALATATLIVIFRGLPVLEPRMWRRLLLIGAVGLGGQAVTMIAGIDAGSSTLGALVLGLEPIGVAVAAVLVARERPTPSTLAGLGLGLRRRRRRLGPLHVGRLRRGQGRRVPAPHRRPLRRLHRVRAPRGRPDRRRCGGAGDVDRSVHRDAAAHRARRRPRPGRAGRAATRRRWRSSCTSGWGAASPTSCSRTSSRACPASRFAVAMYAVPTIGVLASWAVLGERPNARDVVGGAMILGAVWVAEHGRGGRDVAPA